MPEIGVFTGCNPEASKWRMATKFKNAVLSLLDADSIARLQLRPMDLPREYQMEGDGVDVRSLYFIENGLGSMTTLFRDGHQVEIGLFGFEGVMGLSGLFGKNLSVNRVFMQIGGSGYISPIDVAEKEFRRYGKFHELCFRYLQTQMMQAGQTGACNASHSVEQRLARWLLLSADRIEQDEVPLTQEFLATMLGSSRTTLTTTAGALQEGGLIEYGRARIKIVDRVGLERVACECYQIVTRLLSSYYK